MNKKNLLRYTLLIIFITSLVSANQTKIIAWDKTEVFQTLDPNKDSVNAVFRLKNNGNKALRISSLEKSNNSLKTIIKGRLIHPNEYGDIECIFPSQKIPGIYKNRINVYFNEEKTEFTTLYYIIEVPNLIRFEPNVLYLDQFKKSFVNIYLDSRYIDKINDVIYDKNLYNVSLTNEEEKCLVVVTPLAEEIPYSSSVTFEVKGKNKYSQIGQLLIINQ